MLEDFAVQGLDILTGLTKLRVDLNFLIGIRNCSHKMVGVGN